MSYECGPLALAMRFGGICLVNELDMASSEVAQGCMASWTVPLCVSRNMVGNLPHPMFRFVATANANGAGDDTDLYQGTQRQNPAFTDRFILCKIGYPDPSVEKKLLRDRYPTLPVSHVKRWWTMPMKSAGCSWEGEWKHSERQHRDHVLPRSLLRWGALTLRFQPLAKQGIQPVTYALDRALVYRAPRETRAISSTASPLRGPTKVHNNATLDVQRIKKKSFQVITHLKGLLKNFFLAERVTLEIFL